MLTSRLQFQGRRRIPVAGLAAAVSSLAVTLAAAHASAWQSSEGTAPAASWSIVERTIVQDQGHWQVDYRLRLDGPAPLTIGPEEIAATVEGWVSNSRAASHAAPRLSKIELAGPSGLAGAAEVVASPDESRRCRERVRLWIWPAGEPVPASALAIAAGASSTTGVSRKDRDGPSLPPPPPLSLRPGQELRARLRLDHDHFLHGPYDPLLGRRSLVLRLGSSTIGDDLPLDRERYLAMPPVVMTSPPPERLDPSLYVSAPDSLHLEAHVPGNHGYRFPEQPVRYATLMRLSYWYLIAPGTEGDCRVRISQYRDAPTSWKVLSEGSRDETLPVIGRWTRVEHVFRTEPEATSLSVDFRISGAEIGEMWIDDLILEPVLGPKGP